MRNIGSQTLDSGLVARFEVFQAPHVKISFEVSTSTSNFSWACMIGWLCTVTSSSYRGLEVPEYVPDPKCPVSSEKVLWVTICALGLHTLSPNVSGDTMSDCAILKWK